MSTEENKTKTLNVPVAVGAAIFTAAEAATAYFTVMRPLSFSAVNTVLICLIVTALPIALAVMFGRGYVFARNGLTAVFGTKAVLVLVPVLVPFENVSGAMKIFGAVDAGLCFCAFAGMVYLSAVRLAFEEKLGEEHIAALIRREWLALILTGLSAALCVCESVAVPSAAAGGASAAVLALALLMAVAFVRGAWGALCFFAVLGLGAVAANITALVNEELTAPRAVLFSACILAGAGSAVLVFLETARHFKGNFLRERKKSP